jgi:AcrR family transcriptional regulator
VIGLITERKPVDRRKQVLDASARSFETYGYKATTMDQIAKLAGVGKGTIYTFFANKEELFAEIMTVMIRELKELADSTLNPGLPFEDNLLEVLHKLLDYREQHALAVKLAQEVRDIGTPMAREGLESLERAVVAYISRHVREAVDKGEIKPCDPDLTAYLMLKTYLALTVESHHLHKPLGKEDVLHYFRKYWMEGLAAR